MYKQVRNEEWPAYSGRYILKEHRVIGNIRRCYCELKDIETYTFISNEALPTQLKTIALFKEATLLLIKDGLGEYQVWTHCADTDTYVRNPVDERHFIIWCLERLGGALIREFLSASFYDTKTYRVVQVGFTNITKGSKPLSLHRQFSVTTNVGNRYNLAKTSNFLEGRHSVVNSDGVLREYRTDIHSQGYGRTDAKTGMFIYLIEDKILKPNTIYNLSTLLEEYNQFNEIPAFKSNQKEYEHEY